MTKRDKRTRKKEGEAMSKTWFLTKEGEEKKRKKENEREGGSQYCFFSCFSCLDIEKVKKENEEKIKG